MGFLKDFKEFAVRGNVIDLAVGVVIGAAFGKIVTAAVDDIIMPLIAAVTGKTKFDDKFLIMGDVPAGDVSTLAKAKEAGANVLAYGHLIQSVVDFIIIAFCIFLAVRGINRLNRKKEEAAPAGPSSTDALLIEIRDLLKQQGRS